MVECFICRKNSEKGIYHTTSHPRDDKMLIMRFICEECNRKYSIGFPSEDILFADYYGGLSKEEVVSLLKTDGDRNA